MIPVYKPWLTSLERGYADEAVSSSWISSTGKYIDRAEELFANFIGAKYALVASSGTTALHLCYRALDLPTDGCIIIPNITFIATAFTATYDRRPIQFVDVDPDTWNLNLDQVEEICVYHKVSAVVPVHLYGNPADMDRLLQLQKEFGFKIIEDACESLGAKIRTQMTGVMGDVGCFSFYGNKTFTCGEGGAIVTNDENVYRRAKLLRGQAQDPQKRYWHVDIGYNYRLTNLQAAILCGQLERSSEILAEKARVSGRYLHNLNGVIQLQKVLPGHEHSYWLFSFLLPPHISNTSFSEYMANHGVDTRKVFYPILDMPPYAALNGSDGFSMSAVLSERGVSLPSYPELTDIEIDRICDLVKSYLA